MFIPGSISWKTVSNREMPSLAVSGASAYWGWELPFYVVH